MNRKPKDKKVSSLVFTQAPEWNQNIALAKADLLDFIDLFLKTHKAELGVTRAVNRCLKLFNKGLIGEEIKTRLRRKKVKPRTYYTWRKHRNIKGLDGLLEKYKNVGCKINPEIREKMEGMVWGNHLCRYQDVREDLEVLFKKNELPSYSTITRYVKKYKAENWCALVLKHEGRKGLRDRNMEVALGRRDEDLTQPNQRWETDTTIADLFTDRKIKEVVLVTKDGKRCKLIGVEDIFSRSLKFFLVEKETALMVGQVIRDRIMAWGVPGELVIDNGKPYKNRRILHFLKNTGIAVHICIPGNPVEKPHIERAFRTLSEKLFRRLRGYSGNSVQTRPNEIEIEYTMNEAQRVIDGYFTNIYAEKIHRSTGQRPRERMNPPNFVPKTIPERELDILLMEEYKRKVRRGHIAYQGGKYFHPKLPEDQTVKIRVNDFDASEILVFANRKFLCVAEDLCRKGKTPKELREAKKERDKELRTRIKAHEALINKQKPKDASILALIDHHEKIKPLELPKKSDVLEFPELKNIPYTRPVTSEDSKESKKDPGEGQGSRLIRDKQEMYSYIRRREEAGAVLDDYDIKFLKDFLDSNEYRMLGSFLEERLKMEVINER